MRNKKGFTVVELMLAIGNLTLLKLQTFANHYEMVIFLSNFKFKY